MDIKTKKGQDAAPDSPIPYYSKVAVGLSVGLYKPGTGTRSWIVRYRHENKYRTKALKPHEAETYAEAVEQAQTFAAEVRAGNAPSREELATAKLGDMTVRQLIKEYVEQPSVEASKGDRYHQWAYEANKRCNAYVFSDKYFPLGDKRIKDVTTDDIQTLQLAMQKRMTAASVNRNLVTLRAALNYGFSKGYLKSAPWKGASLLEEAEHDDRENAKAYNGCYQLC